ncbi:serine/threonine-protein kinase [Streptomyces sulphureus]|uniref:serine/threonine-protein kinase n=1 Tax=Streptomyces sulphureus TaxID=47758 RepID=UPI0004777AA1|nr:serine/threonine-protein kinase [Streptomyces sulphureus]
MTGGTRGQLVDDRFELLEKLGSGGMGTVWRARDTALHREVALKEVRPLTAELTPDGSDTPAGSEGVQRLRERVLREARALARLNHPNVVTIHHIVDAPDQPPWLVMELLPGETLQDRLAQNPLAPADAARLGRQMLAALRTAHRAGIHHRDVKPGNVLLREDGSAVLTDFGIAALQGATSLTAPGEFLGSPEYVAPERIRGTDAPEGDLWSLGITLYVATEGRSPLRRATTLATLAAVLDDPLPPAQRSGPLAPVLDALLVRDPAARPSPERLDAMLAEVAENRSPAPQPPPGAFAAPHAAPPGPPTPPHSAPPYGAFGPPPAASPEPQQQPPGGRFRLRDAMIIGGALVAATLIALGAYLLVDTEDERTAPSPTPSGGSASPGGAHPEGGVSPAPTPSANAEDEREADATTSPPRTSGASTPEGPRGAEHRDSWVAQLASVPKSEGVAERERHETALAGRTDGVRWVDSDDYASLRSGYWMLYRPGPSEGGGSSFESGQAAADWCASSGLSTSNQCVGRYLSDDAADRVYVCSPDNSRGTGRCSRE